MMRGTGGWAYRLERVHPDAESELGASCLVMDIVIWFD